VDVVDVGTDAVDVVDVVDFGAGAGIGGCGPVEEAVGAGMIGCANEVVFAGAFSTGAVPVLNVSELLVVSMDGWEDNAALGTAAENGFAAELVAYGCGCCFCCCGFGSVAADAAGGLECTKGGVGPATAAAVVVFKDVTLSALVVVVAGTVTAPFTNGTEDDGTVEGTTAGVGLQDSVRVALASFLECIAVTESPPLLAVSAPTRGLLGSLFPPVADIASVLIVAEAGSGSVSFING
jgi:hypothetical protein